MFLGYDSAEEAVYMLGGCADGLLEVLDDHTTYRRDAPPEWVARLAGVRELANRLRAETDTLHEEYSRAIGDIP